MIEAGGLSHRIFNKEAKTPYPPFCPPKSPAISLNCSSAASRSCTISWAMTSGGGRFSESARLSSFSQKMSRLALSRPTSSA